MPTLKATKPSVVAYWYPIARPHTLVKGIPIVEKYTEEHPAPPAREHDRGEAMVFSGEGQVPSGLVMLMCATLVHPPVVLPQWARFMAQYISSGGELLLQ